MTPSHHAAVIEGMHELFLEKGWTILNVSPEGVLAEKDGQRVHWTLTEWTVVDPTGEV